MNRHADIAQQQAPDVQRRDDGQFRSETDKLIKAAEDTRLTYMGRYQKRGFVALSGSLLSVLAGAGGFGWYFLIQYDLLSAVACMALALTVPALLHIWARGILKAYTKNYKAEFMPKMAKALGDLKFFPERGISAKIIARTGVIPAHKRYEAEDCFMGKYKGVKVLLSEARLYDKKNKPVFKGVFVLLETPGDVIDGHTIITADKNMVRQWAPTRWQKLQRVDIQAAPAEQGRFEIYSDNPEAARLFVGERFLKELAEAADIFDQSPMSTVLFRNKFVFMAIPYEQDMFEASSMHIPITTSEHAMHCKREIEQILEIIDIFDLYKGAATTQDAQ